MSTVMVIGATSTIARALLPQITAKYSVITAGRQDCDVYCDVTKDITIPSGVDVVVNFAAAFGGETDEEIEIAVQTNKFGVLRVCEAASKAGVKQVVHISSIFALITQGDPSFSIYALTKKQGDDLAESYAAKNNLPLTILRPSRVYGDDHSFAKGQPFLYKMIDTAAMGQDITFYGAQDTSRNYIHVADLAEVLIRVIAQRISGVYVCIYPEDITISQIATIAQRLYGMGGVQKFERDKPDIPHDKHFDDTSLYEKINYRPVIDMQTGIVRIKQHIEKEAVQ